LPNPAHFDYNEQILYLDDERQRRKKLETVRKHFRAGHQKEDTVLNKGNS